MLLRIQDDPDYDPESVNHTSLRGKLVLQVKIKLNSMIQCNQDQRDAYLQSVVDLKVKRRGFETDIK